MFPYLGSLPVPVRTTRRRFSARINWIFWNSNLDGCNPIGGELIAPYRETHVAFSNIVHSSACNVSRDISSRWRDLEEKSAPFTGWRTRGGGGDLRLSFDRCSVKSCHANGVRASKRSLNFFPPLPTPRLGSPIRNARVIAIIGCARVCACDFISYFHTGCCRWMDGWAVGVGRGIYRLPPRVYILAFEVTTLFK